MIRTTIAGRFPEPSWLPDPGAQLLAPWVASADRLREAQDDAGGHPPTTTTIEVSRLATDANCKLELSAIAVADSASPGPRRAPRKRRRPS